MKNIYTIFSSETSLEIEEDHREIIYKNDRIEKLEKSVSFLVAWSS